MHRSFEIVHAGCLVVSRDFVGSAVEDIELFQEARIWTIRWRLLGCVVCLIFVERAAYSTSGRDCLMSSRAASVSSWREYMRYAATMAALRPRRGLTILSNGIGGIGAGA